jgi:hypothetical protein
VERLCFGPRGGVPIGDVLLQQKLALEGDEEATLRIAGRTPVPIMGQQAYWMRPEGLVQMDARQMYPAGIDQNLQVRTPPDYMPPPLS